MDLKDTLALLFTSPNQDGRESEETQTNQASMTSIKMEWAGLPRPPLPHGYSEPSLGR